MDTVCSKAWQERKEKNRKKVDWLYGKWRRGSHREETEVRGVKFRDEDLQVQVDDKNPEVVAYGGVEITENMSEVLKINPNMMTFEKVEPLKIEMEIEKSFFKARYDFMSRNEDAADDDNDEDDENEDINQTETLNLEEKSVNYSKLRVTNLPTCSSLVVPKPGPVREESVMSGMKEKMLDEVKRYIKDECDDNGWPKSNLTRSEVAGMREINPYAFASILVAR